MRRLPQLDPDAADIETVYCFGCGRKIGVTQEIRNQVFCDELCWHKPQLVNLETAARTRALTYLTERVTLSASALAEAFGITRARVTQLLAQGNIDYRAEPMTEEQRAKKSRAGKISYYRNK